MQLFGDSKQEIREHKGTLHSWEKALYAIGRQKAYQQHEAKKAYRSTGYRENSLSLLGWPTQSHIIEALEINARETQAAQIEDPYQDLLKTLSPAIQQLIEKHIGRSEAGRLAAEQKIDIFHQYLAEVNSAAYYYLSLQPVGEISWQNARQLENHVSPTTIQHITEGEFSLPLHHWVKGLILRLAAPQTTYCPPAPNEPPQQEPTTAQLKNSADWINQPHHGIGKNLPQAIEAMKRYRLAAALRGDTAKIYPLEEILQANPPIQTLKGQPIEWQAWKFIPCPFPKTKEQIIEFLDKTPSAARFIEAAQAQTLAQRWLRAIALRGAINAHFLEIEINQQEQTERTIINPAKEEADALAGAIPELHLVVATESAWEYFCYYWIHET